MSTFRLQLAGPKLQRAVLLCVAMFATVIPAPFIFAQSTEITKEALQDPSNPLSIVRGSDEIRLFEIRRYEVERLQPWIARYLSLKTFEERNVLAFRFAHRGYNWPDRLSLMALDPKTTDEAQVAIAHFASAHGKSFNNWMVAVDCLKHPEPWIAAGYLKILRSARELRPDGSDREWPASGPLDPKRLPKHIAAVMEMHPALALDVAQTLEVYGPLAMKEAEKLMPLLKSKDDAVVAAAQSAIRKMDSEGLAKVFHLSGKPLTPIQKDWINHYLFLPTAYEMVPPVMDLRESDGSHQSELSQRYGELQRYVRLQRDESFDGAVGFEGDKEVALYFCDRATPEDWWKPLSTAYADQNAEFGLSVLDDFLLYIASALYTKPGAQSELIQVLQDKDYRVVQGVLHLIADMRLFNPGTTDYYDGDLVDPEVMPAHIRKVLDQHPYLYRDVAKCLSVYGTHASAQVEALVPFLLSDDTVAVKRIRQSITSIDPKLAEKLEVTLESPVDGPSKQDLLEDESVDGPPPLTPRQRELLEVHLKIRK